MWHLEQLQQLPFGEWTSNFAVRLWELVGFPVHTSAFPPVQWEVFEWERKRKREKERKRETRETKRVSDKEHCMLLIILNCILGFIIHLRYGVVVSNQTIENYWNYKTMVLVCSIRTYYWPLILQLNDLHFLTWVLNISNAPASVFFMHLMSECTHCSKKVIVTQQDS